MKLWEFDEKVRLLAISGGLFKYGEIIGHMESPYSIIYTARSHHSSELYVAKAPKIDQTMASEEVDARMRRFIGEIQNIYRVCHHDLIHRFGYFEMIHGVPFLISPKRDMTLRDLIEGPGMNITDACAIAIQVARALQYLGESGIICHQDLKAENIFIADLHRGFPGYPFRYRAYVADLDMANAAITLGRPFGSRPYMAPEQYVALEDRVHMDYSKVDVFALAVNFFEMLSAGIHPCGERTVDVWPDKPGKFARETFWKNWARRDPRIKADTASVPSGLLEIISLGLAPNPRDRPNAGQIKALLLDWLRKENSEVASHVVLFLEMLDDAEKVNSSAGWPYMDHILSKAIRGLDENDENV